MAEEVLLGNENREVLNSSIVQGTTFLPSGVLLLYNNPNNNDVLKKIEVIVTAYSSTPEETDETPFITAAGTWVKDGIVANNMYSFGTKIKLPEIYGDKVFIVEDRMNSKKGSYHVDVWFPSKESALAFGTKITEMSVLTH
jgi:3D (Asp-Asp-Asp) domain-containing protein